MAAWYDCSAGDGSTFGMAAWVMIAVREMEVLWYGGVGNDCSARGGNTVASRFRDIAKEDLSSQMTALSSKFKKEESSLKMDAVSH
ncbi:hypothetical protein HNY73_015336 [Argiope bruennichi]|uniref:Uncharacterized protein n=1 Tax=Argiope bruennichi TaxID=94029 RepID=A0A8T0ERR5_ARGBR|nr:hypothetical protein HNY73_015336 [Argiope bruennichi]